MINEYVIKNQNKFHFEFANQSKTFIFFDINCFSDIIESN